MSQPHNPARAARRKAEAIEQLGTEQPCCIFCGNTDPLLVRPRRIQNHHIFGEGPRSSHRSGLPELSCRCA